MGTQTENLLKLSPSALSNFFVCPYKFKLSREHRIDIDSEAMRTGRLFEGYLFGFKEDNDCSQKSLEGRKKSDTLDFLKSQADFVRPVFEGLNSGDGDKYVNLEHIYNSFHLRGEIDYIGKIDTKKLSELCGSEIDSFYDYCIVDVKYTANVSKIWDSKEQQSEFIQAATYPYMWYKKTGEKYPFAYLIIDAQCEKPIVRFMPVEFDDNFYFIKNLISSVSAGYDFNTLDPIISEDTCGGSKNYQTRCQYIEHCKHGRAFIGGCSEIKFTL